MFFFVCVCVYGGGHAFGYLLSNHCNSTESFADVSISGKMQKFDNFSGFCSPEFDLFIKNLAIFRSKGNEQYSSIPKIK